MTDILKADYRSLKPACDALLNGGVIAFPTETVYGIGVIADNPGALEALRQLKGREAEKPFQILIPRTSWASKYANTEHPGAQRLMQAFWPGPLTLVLPTADGNTNGLRVPDNKWLHLLMLEIGCGIVATSANIAGGMPANSATEIDKDLGSKIELIIDDGIAAVGEGSSVAGIAETGELEIFRHGAIPAERLQEVFSAAE